MRASQLIISTLSILAVALLSAVAERTRTDFWGSPRELVEEYWKMGMNGDLLTPEGWNRAAGFFRNPTPQPRDKSLRVFSNYYGLYRVTTHGETAEVVMDYDDAGRIDDDLRYIPPPRSTAFKTGIAFQLALTPTYLRMFGPDGKTEIGRKPTGDSAWEIEGSPPMPWTTVNTAIRYVLEARNKTTDPAIKKNADETLAKLLTLH